MVNSASLRQSLPAFNCRAAALSSASCTTRYGLRQEGSLFFCLFGHVGSSLLHGLLIAVASLEAFGLR